MSDDAFAFTRMTEAELRAFQARMHDDVADAFRQELMCMPTPERDWREDVAYAAVMENRQARRDRGRRQRSTDRHLRDVDERDAAHIAVRVTERILDRELDRLIAERLRDPKTLASTLVNMPADARRQVLQAVTVLCDALESAGHDGGSNDG